MHKGTDIWRAIPLGCHARASALPKNTQLHRGYEYSSFLISNVDVSGWLTVAGWQATIASCSYLTASLVQGILVLTQPNYTPHNWHATILFWAIIAFAVVITTGANWLLPMFEAIILFIHIAGFLGIIVPLLAMGPHENAHDVFTTFINRGGWDTQGLSFCIGMMGTVYAFVGGDGAIHVCAEEGCTLGGVNADFSADGRRDTECACYHAARNHDWCRY